MKTIAVSNRVDVTEPHEERRDSLDQRWTSFIHEVGGLVPLFIPNHIETAKYLLEIFPVSGILLTGGNDLMAFGGNVPERDETENLMIDFAIQHRIPMLGVCRGMQMIQQYFGSRLEKIEGHANSHHDLVVDGVPMEVNSYHNYGVINTSGELKIVAKTSDGVVEAVRHPDYSIEGIMWHPERNTPFNDLDNKFFKKIFGAEGINK